MCPIVWSPVRAEEEPMLWRSKNIGMEKLPAWLWSFDPAICHGEFGGGWLEKNSPNKQINWLVVDLPLWKIWKSIFPGWIVPYMKWKITNVWNHQPYIYILSWNHFFHLFGYYQTPLISVISSWSPMILVGAHLGYLDNQYGTCPAPVPLINFNTEPKWNPIYLYYFYWKMLVFVRVTYHNHIVHSFRFIPRIVSGS